LTKAIFSKLVKHNMLLARAYSHHSLLSAVPKIPDLVKTAKAKGYTTVALTDEDTGSGLIEFYQVCKQEGINPAVGATLRIANVTTDSSSFGRTKGFSKIAIIAKNNQGYVHLIKLITTARIIQEQPKYHLTLDNFQNYRASNDYHFFVSLCGNDHELIAQLKQNNLTAARHILQVYTEVLGAQNLLVELAIPTKKDDPKMIQQINLNLASLCDQFEVQYLASPAPRYLDPSDADTFRVVLAIRDQLKVTQVELERDFGLPTVEELQQQFAYLPKACDTRNLEQQIALTIRCDYDKHANEAFFPKLNLPKGQTASQTLKWEAYLGLLEKFSPEQKTREEWKLQFPYAKLDQLVKFAKTIFPNTSQLKGYPKDYWEHTSISQYIDRLEYELEVIRQKGYSDYFLVFADIMNFCRQRGIVTNTRGSAAGSLVGYLVNIGILDPVLYKIPFERFLNPLRPSAPDIDGDFADDRREEVIEYLKNKYGLNKVCQIITFGTILPRMAVRDVGRVLGVSYKKCDRLAKLIPVAPQGRKTTFTWALEISPELREVYEKDPESKTIIEISKKLEGNYRHASVHAAGVYITPTELSDYTPLQWDSEHKMIISQYDWHIGELVGLVKLDILGIRNLAILGNSIRLAEQRRGVKIDLLNLDLEDAKTYELLSKGRTMGLFQLSGETMTKYLIELEPTKVTDLMAMVALYRPGPMANIPEYIRRKKNPKLVKYYVPQMEKWMKESYGILVYQDDLLYTVIELAGYDWLEADNFRKGVGKKIPAVLEEQHVRFVQGCIEHSGLTKEKAEELWNLIVPFAAYGFNKAHSCNYGMVAYWTAYMKANYTVEFMTALMTAEADKLDKIALAIKECRELGIQVKPPDLNRSFYGFTIEDDYTIRYGLSSIKNLGDDVIQYIINYRSESGQFQNIEDFLEAIKVLSSFNKRNLEALIWSGALDQVGANSRQMT